MVLVSGCLLALTWIQPPSAGSMTEPQPARAVLAAGCYPVRSSGALGARLWREPGPAARSVRRWTVRLRIARELRLGGETMHLAASELPAIRAAAAGFVTAVRQMTRGRVQVALDIETLKDPVVVPAASAARRNGFPVPVAELPLGVSGAGVESVFLVFPAGARDWPMLGGTYGGVFGPDGAGASAIAWVPLRRREMVRVFVHEWLHQIEWLARERFSMPWLPGSHDLAGLGFAEEMTGMAAILGDLVPLEFWQQASMRGRVRAPKRLASADAPNGWQWGQVATDPLRRLPLWGDLELSRLLGVPAKLRVEEEWVELVLGGRARRGESRRSVAGEARVRGVIDRILDLRHESLLCARLTDSDRYLLLVRGDRVEAFATRLPGTVRGVLLPLQRRRAVGIWAAGGTAIPLVAFVATLAKPPETEVELLRLGGAAWSRAGGPAVVGQPLVWQAPRGDEVLARLAGRPVRGPLATVTPSGVRPLRLRLARGRERLDYRIPVLPRVEITLSSSGDRAPRRRVAWVSGTLALQCTLKNHTAMPVTLRLVSDVGGKLAAKFAVEGLPATVSLPAGGTNTMTLRLATRGEVEAGKAGSPSVPTSGSSARSSTGSSAGSSAGSGLQPVARTVRIRALCAGSVWGEGALGVWQANGDAFLKLGFEEKISEGEIEADTGGVDGTSRSGAPPWRPPGARVDEVSSRSFGHRGRGEWTGEVRLDAAEAGQGAGWLRLADGGGSRFGSFALMSADDPAYDTAVFPFLDFRFRATAQPGARVALNLTVGDRVVSVPLVGPFRRAWDRRRALRRPRIETDGRWQRVIYDLDAALHAVLGEGPHRVRRIEIGDTRALCSNRFRGADAARFDLDAFVVRRTRR